MTQKQLNLFYAILEQRIHGVKIRPKTVLPGVTSGIGTKV